LNALLLAELLEPKMTEATFKAKKSGDVQGTDSKAKDKLTRLFYDNYLTSPPTYYADSLFLGVVAAGIDPNLLLTRSTNSS